MRSDSSVDPSLLEQLKRLNADLEEAVKYAKTLESRYRNLEREYLETQVWQSRTRAK